MVGRPSKALERRDEILDAMEICVRKQGIALASMRRIAEQSGLSLQMISHYFGNRQSLILAFVERLSERLLAEMDHADFGDTPRDRLINAVKFLCDGRYKELTGNDVIGREIWGMAERDEDVRRIVWTAYDRSLDHLAHLIKKAYPHVSSDQAKATSYAILCLTEAHEFFSGISERQAPKGAAEQAALGLLALLETQTSDQVSA
jgi:AcrR family transcriptional regulator